MPVFVRARVFPQAVYRRVLRGVEKSFPQCGKTDELRVPTPRRGKPHGGRVGDRFGVRGLVRAFKAATCCGVQSGVVPPQSKWALGKKEINIQ